MIKIKKKIVALSNIFKKLKNNYFKKKKYKNNMVV